MNPRRSATTLSICMAILLSACQTPWGASPAVLRTVNDAAQHDINTAVAQMLGASKVLVDATPLTRSPLLTLERAPIKDPQGVRVQGLNLEMPEVFRLEMYAGKCRLVQIKTGQSRALQQAACQPAP
jgi:hypothetical protein